MSERRIGLWGAVATLVGYVIGASIFVLPAELLPSAGAGVLVAYLLAAVPAVFTCVCGAVIANVFPVSGASYVSVRETLSPRVAFHTAWAITCAASLGAALVAWGLADYAAWFWPTVPPMAIALTSVVVFVLLNLTPVTVTVAAQGAMVVLFALVIAAFAVGGLLRGNWALATPLVPSSGAVLGGAVAAYFSYAGLQVLIDIGGEIRDPGRTIPRALALSFATVLLLYLGFVLAVVVLSGNGTDAQASALVGRIAERTFGAGFARAIVVSALLAAATSINGIFFTQARDVHALARDGRLPRVLAGTTNGIPRAAVLALGVVALAATAVGASVRSYAVLTAMCMMAVQAVLGLSALRAPVAAPAAWATSQFRPGPGTLRFFGWGLVVVSTLFFVLGASQSALNAVLFVAVLVSGELVYRLQARHAGATPPLP